MRKLLSVNDVIAYKSKHDIVGQSMTLLVVYALQVAFHDLQHVDHPIVLTKFVKYLLKYYHLSIILGVLVPHQLYYLMLMLLAP